MRRAKYAPLEKFLKEQTAQEIPITFAEIERIIGDALPPAALKYRPWWSNNPSNSVMTSAWLNAGFKTERVDMEGRRLIFRRVAAAASGSSREGGPSAVSETPSSYVAGQRHPLFGALKGTIRMSPGSDLTDPADPDWGTSGE